MTPHFEHVWSQVLALPPADRHRLSELLAQSAAPPAMREEEFQAHLLQLGVLSELPNTLALRPQQDEFQPIVVQGKPLSETIIEERR